MLKKNLNYVCFDFETTWLDTEKDEAIQIWIIKFNYNFNILDKFESYIKPNNFDNLSNLSEIVEFTTWINLEQLKKEPTFYEIENNIKKFFDKKTIVIWHNIQFDINFLKKYIKDITFLKSFDTYEFSRLLFHFEPSYALEILADKYNFKTKSHDALQDSIMSMELFKIIIKKIEKLLNRYPSLANVINKSNSILNEIIDLKTNNQKIFSIPKKWLNLQKPKKLKLPKPYISDYTNKTVFNISNISLDEAISFAINWQNKVILSFASNSRTNCAKTVLRNKLIPSSPLNTWFILSKKNEEKLLNKDKLEDFESHYILKAFSHYDNDLSIFDISNFNEIKIYNFLINEKREFTSNIIITTHKELFNYIKNYWKEKIKDFIIVFFDWYQCISSLWQVINKWFDFYDFINKLEILKYKFQYDNKEKKIEDLINKVSTFFWIVWIKIQPLFKWTNNKIELVNILEETKNWLNQLKTPFKEIDLEINNFINLFKNKTDINTIKQEWNIFKECIENYCIIEQKITFWDKLKYVFQPLMENIDINTFNDFMDWTKYYCYSITENKSYIKLWNWSIEKKLVNYEQNLDFKKLVEDIKNEINDNKSIYLISNNKNFSNNLFKLIFNLFKEYNLKWNIYAENITWWQWKLLYYLKKDKWPKVTIWWPEFLIQNKAKNISYNHYYILSINWKYKEIIIKNLEFYLK